MPANFEPRLGLYRKQAGWSQDQLAQMVGVTRQTIANIEAGRNEPGVMLGMALAAVLRVPVHELFRPAMKIIGQIRRYRFHAGPLQAWSPHSSLLTADSFARGLQGATVRGLAQLPAFEGYHVEVQLERQSHEQALNEIEELLGQFGLRLVEGYVVEVANAAAETALTAAAGGGLIGSGSKNAGAALAGALIGLAVGAAVGSQLERIVAAYSVTRAYPSGWQLIPIPLRQSGNAESQPG